MLGEILFGALIVLALTVLFIVPAIRARRARNVDSPQIRPSASAHDVRDRLNEIAASLSWKEQDELKDMAAEIRRSISQDGAAHSLAPVDAEQSDALRGVKLTEDLLGDRQRRERALLSVLELSRSGDPLGCAALDVSILIKSQGKEGRYTAEARVVSGSPVDLLRAAKQRLLELASSRSLLDDPRASGAAIAQLMTFGGPEEQKELMLGILGAGGDDQLGAFQLLGTDLQATAMVKQVALSGSVLDSEIRFETIKGGILERTGPLADAHGWR